MGGSNTASPRKTPTRSDNVAAKSPNFKAVVPTKHRKSSPLRFCVFCVILAWSGTVIASYYAIVSDFDSTSPQWQRSSTLRARRDTNDPSDGTTKIQMLKSDAANKVGNASTVERRKLSGGGSGRRQRQEAPKNERAKPLIAPGELHCQRHGGPMDDDEAMKEMVYWKTIPSDFSYRGLFFRDGNNSSTKSWGPTKKYITFELDDCGFNNNRMVFETVLTLAHATGRTLVIPPRRFMYGMNATIKQTGYNDYYDLDELDRLYDGIQFVSTEEFLKTENGKLINQHTLKMAYPPRKRTNWDGVPYLPFRKFIRSVSVDPNWDPEMCLVAFPTRPGPDGMDEYRSMAKRAMRPPKPLPIDFQGKPTPVMASAEQRFREAIAQRETMCLYTETLQRARIIHFPVKETYRFMSHFYSALFFSDWRADLWYKRLMRDRLRFRDEIVCAAARIVGAVRSRARTRNPASNPDGIFDAFHIRRTDFQVLYEGLANETGQMIFDRAKEWIPPDKRRTVYIATDERNRTFFRPLENAYDVQYLDDYMHLIEGMSSNFYPMIEMLVAARSQTFVGMFWSTFTGYINRLRGYYSVKDKLDGYKSGVLRNSHHYNTVSKVNPDEYHVYKAIKLPAWYREYPTAWRDIDWGVGAMRDLTKHK